MTDPRPAGPILDALGVTFDLDEHDQVTDILVIGRTADFESGQTGFLLGRSQGLDWVTQYGLLAIAQKVLDETGIEEAD